jgi:hypothetical protein
MPTKVFISWSGELSRKLGDALRNWLPSTLQYVKPYFTPEDIEKGAKWNSEIAKELETSNIGVVCLTRDNTEKPWILFEAGALSKTIEKSHVCTLLFDLEPAEVKGPLTSFQATRFAKDDFKKLVVTINSAAGDARLDSAVLDTVFEMWWPKLEEQVVTILKSHDKGAKKEKRSDRDILEELLELTRLSTTRAPRPSRVSPRALIELVESMDELSFILAHEHGDIGMRILHRIERPIRHLCLEAGMPEVYERFRTLRGRREPPGLELEMRLAEPGAPPDAAEPRR